MVDPSRNLIFQDDFLLHLGMFQGTWSSLEVMASFGIGMLLKIGDEEAHIITAGMEFGRKAMLLRNLANRSDHPNKGRIARVTSKIMNESKRNIFAHGIVLSNEDRVLFIDRSRGGDYVAKEYEFTIDEFRDHVGATIKLGGELDDALGNPSGERLQEFCMAALSVNTKSTKSPVPPSESA